MVNEWTREDLPADYKLWDDLQGQYPGLRILSSFPMGTLLDAVVEHLNAHHPKPPHPMSPEATTLRRERDAAVYAYDKADRERDEWKARAGAAEARTAPLPVPGDGCQCTGHREHRGHGSFERVLEYEPSCPEHSEHVWSPRTGIWEHAAPAVTREDVSEAIRQGWGRGDSGSPHGVLDAVWSLVSGADPAVHVVRESDLPAARVSGDYYVTVSERGVRRWNKHGHAWWEEFAQKALAEAACYTAVARLAAEPETDPVLDKARELWRVVHEDDGIEWHQAVSDVRDRYFRLARHVLGQEAKR